MTDLTSAMVMIRPTRSDLIIKSTSLFGIFTYVPWSNIFVTD